MGNAGAHVSLVLLVGNSRRRFAHRMKVVDRHPRIVYSRLHAVEMVAFAVGNHLQKHHFALIAIENDDIFIQDIQNVGRIVDALGGIFHSDVLQIAHGVERRVAVESAIVACLAADLERRNKIGNGASARIVGIDVVLPTRPVGIDQRSRAVRHLDVRYRLESDERAIVLAAMVVRTLHQSALREQVAQFQVSAYRRMNVAEHSLMNGMIFILSHND